MRRAGVTPMSDWTYAMSVLERADAWGGGAAGVGGVGGAGGRALMAFDIMMFSGECIEVLTEMRRDGG